MPGQPYCGQLTLATCTYPFCGRTVPPPGGNGPTTGGPSWKAAELTMPDAKLVPPAEGTDAAGVLQMVELVEPHTAVVLELGVPPPWPPLRTGATPQ